MAHYGIAFTYRPSDQPTTAADITAAHRLFILSDYPSAMLDREAQQRILAAVRDGAGLVMIGGWESFCGLGGNWADTPIADALPVNISRQDDRINCPQPALIRPLGEHAITAHLPWSAPPCIGGFNAFTAKRDAQVLLEVQRYSVTVNDGQAPPVFEVRHTHPLLAVATSGRGRTAALATDVAPHWVGGFVDWGAARITACAPGGGEVEVGSDYARFFQQLLKWTGRLT
jgi:uncharacterized membrane protein